MAVVLPVLVAFSACAHLAQKKTYTQNPRTIALQQHEYLEQELVQGLPEEAFRRWYTRDPSWEDPTRPSILATRQESGETLYDVGSGNDIAAEVVFKGGALDRWNRWQLVQESVSSTWTKGTVVPPRVDAATLARVAALNPQTQPLHLADRPRAADLCRYEPGDEVETLVPLQYDTAHGNRLDRFVAAGSATDPRGALAVLPAGSRLTIKRWNPIEGRNLVGADGVAFHIDAPLGLQTFDEVFCPAGRCVPGGEEGVTSRDLDVATPPEPGAPGVAVVPGSRRLPLWMTPGSALKAGTTVRIKRWHACTSMDAEIEITAAGPAGTHILFKVPVAPPGLFTRASAPPARAGTQAGSGS
jgi:hypothetical protein